MAPSAVSYDAAGGVAAGNPPLNVIIPIGGIGSRFAKNGYRYPKPLINIVGRPMLLWLLDSLTLQPDDVVWVAINEEVDDEFHIGQLIGRSLSSVNHNVIRLRHQTKGASETLYVVCQSMSAQDLGRRTVSLDCDTIYWNDILGDVRKMPDGHGGCFYFADDGDKPIFSYVKTEPRDGLEHIVDIKEKRAISTKANSGAYVFRNAGELRTLAAEVLDHTAQESHKVGEYYTSKLIAYMIDNGIPFIGLPLAKEDISFMGTPQQLEDFLKSIKKSGRYSARISQRRRFCFDLDMTLVGAPAVPGDYSTCPPIEKNIRLVKQLYQAGHYIIIHTARRMRTCNGNVGLVVANVGAVTYAQLAQMDIPFDELHFGKPYADVYIDDLAVNANLDTSREIGWYAENTEPTTSDEERAEAGAISGPKKTGMIAARDFNVVQIIDNKVIKSSKADKILGEIYLYSHMPPDIAHLFPRVDNVDFIPETRTYSITMENCRGLTYSHMLVGRSITKGRLLALLQSLHKIHSSSRTDQPTLPLAPALEDELNNLSQAQGNQGANIYANYYSKLRSRYKRYRDRYDALGEEAASIFSRLSEFLDTYEAEKKGLHAQVIHGDPVFSNAILSSEDERCVFIDVRYRLGDMLTSEGDINYDLAKVLQSLCGYDHVLLMSEKKDQVSSLLRGDKPLLSSADSLLLGELREIFFSFIKDKYPVQLHRKTLFRITASLFFSLIPLHRAEMGPLFLRMCKETLDRAGGASCD